MELIKVAPPSRKDKIGIRILILIGIISLTSFVYWFFSNANKGNPYLYWPLTIAMLYKLLRMVHEWYHYFGVHVPEFPKSKNHLRVDMLTTYCPGEPKAMIKQTLLAMKAVKYPHTSYLCDEGDDPELKKFCKEIGVIHVTRTIKKDAKAGNINNALVLATGELCVVMDPDHIPIPEFIDRVLPYFEDPKVGYVQCVQGYYNRRESLVALGAAEQTYHFYGPMMMSMGDYGTAQAIGANCTFRRTALNSIGGHAAGLSEDMHTAMQLHAKGWKSIYIPEILTKGLVPGTLPAYYKQQLKWARGTFELLFEVYPKLFTKFTWRQKLHYFTLPLYYMGGVITLIDILVPIIALITGEAAWKIDLTQFALYFIPLFVMSLLIRQYSQRWLLENHEKGFHVIGGLLRIATWWIYLIGFFYSIIRKKIPYIPTPKDDKPKNNFSLAFPNILACVASLGSVIYGLSNDYSQFSLFMSGFSFVNFLLFGFISIISQEKWVNEVYASYYAKALTIRRIYNYTRQRINLVLRNGAIGIAVVGAAALMLFFFTYQKSEVDFIKTPIVKNTGGFYAGIYIPTSDLNRSLNDIHKMEEKINYNFSIVSIYEAWGPESLVDFPDSLLRQISNKGATPMITWEPWSTTFPEYWNHPDLGIDRKICKAIYDGMFDGYITAYAEKIRAHKDPIYLRFAHEPDNPAYPWSQRGGNTNGEYIAAWRYVVKKFEAMGVSNVIWVWNPWLPEAVKTHFPGNKYVDWVGLTCLNYGKASMDGKWRTFEEVYLPYRTEILNFYKQDMKNLYRPIMLAEFGSTSYGGDQANWMKDAMNKIQDKYPEIKATVLFNSNIDSNWATPWRPTEDKYINWTVDDNEEVISYLREEYTKKTFNETPLYLAKAKEGIGKFDKPLHNKSLYNNTAIQKKRGKFNFLVDGKPFYIKGVAYNSGHDWRDGNFPLSKKQILNDLKKIKEMGANTIRRYNPTINDVNILRAADETDLKVLYGFWFDPEIDYYKDSVKVNEYLKKVETTVLKYKHHPSLIGWSVGNETWGLLKHQFSKPYLTKVRISYLQMLEQMAKTIHQLDPDRLVFSSMEHDEYQTAGEIGAFVDWAPSIDVVGINSYYIPQISALNRTFTSIDTTRPYLVSEFGPKGYWKPEYSNMKNDLAFEDSDREKASYYVNEWRNYVAKYEGQNIGGFAFCWRDRFEGSSTWFGLTDMKGRLKPAYFALKNEWTNKKSLSEPLAVYIISPERTIYTNNNYAFHAFSNLPIPKNYKFEWSLCREDRLDYMAGLTPIDDGRSISIDMPKNSAVYRLYLSVISPDGKVSTASSAFRVMEK